MAGPEATSSDTGATTELSVAELRRELPGIEPERRLDDWGRSERVQRLLDRTLLRFLYGYWLRVEAEGVGNIPVQGGALLIANRAALLAGGAMVAKAIREQHARGRTTRLALSHEIQSLPGVGMLATKAGVIAAHPANLHRLLFDEQELVLVLGEARAQTTRRPLRPRYRLGAFDPELVAVARRARVPIVPVAVLGAEEAVPVSLPAAGALPLPAKVRLRVLEAVDPASSHTAAEPERMAGEIRALIQENLLEMVAARRSVWLG